MLLRRSANICPKELTRGFRGYFNSLLGERSDLLAGGVCVIGAEACACRKVANRERLRCLPYNGDRCRLAARWKTVKPEGDSQEMEGIRQCAGSRTSVLWAMFK
jgi:hypothetical protein